MDLPVVVISCHMYKGPINTGDSMGRPWRYID